MKERLYLYSTNTYLAHKLSQMFYNDTHYVWCTPIFNSKNLGTYDIGKDTPPSSTPLNIYNTLKEDVEHKDKHSEKIKQNRAGLMKGATIYLENGLITDEEFRYIKTIIEQAEITDFRPLLYIISYDKVKDKITRVAPELKAHPLSEEYIIPDLHSDEFDILEF
ncbi:MAG: hypothetical protein H9777_07020 [Candidatus Phocaeicola faecigallinarum]|uniref:Uncharacterized protein n=1 Tax=Candidatus Phocaeicola faecigallinarum TaxID=2838732 RepID=A0A948TBR3_9BACT|nr:hypothetical protein [Candidatus Phocaeicola faecigallinarum]